MIKKRVKIRVINHQIKYGKPLIFSMKRQKMQCSKIFNLLIRIPQFKCKSRTNKEVNYRYFHKNQYQKIIMKIKEKLKFFQIVIIMIFTKEMIKVNIFFNHKV